MGTHLHPKYLIMNKLVLVCFLAVATAAPVEDTPEVAAAKASFKAAFTVAEAGEHIALAPVNKVAEAVAMPVASVAYTHVYPAYHHTYPHTYAAYPHAYTGYPYAAFPQLATGYAHYGYNGFPVVMPA